MTETFHEPPPRPARWLAAVERAAERTLGVVAALMLFAMMVMTTVDVLGRYLLSAPLGYAYEMTQIGMAALVFAALPIVTIRREHITVGLFETVITGRAGAVRDILVALVAVAGSTFLAWRLWVFAERVARYGDYTATLRLPLAPVVTAGAIAFLLTAVAALVIAAAAFLRLIGRAE